MPFLGKQPTAGFASIVKDDLTPNGSTTAFTLSKQVANANDIAVFLGNVRQEPTDAYTVSGTTLTMSEAPASGLNFYVLHIAGTVESSVVPADNTISTAKLQSSAVTDAKLASTLDLSGKTVTYGLSNTDLPVGTVVQTKHYGYGNGNTGFNQNIAANLTSGQTVTLGSGTITPTSSSNKILVFGTNLCHNDSNTGYSYFRIIRGLGGSDSIIMNPGNAVGFQYPSGARIPVQFNLLDNPSTTSQITYSQRVDHHGLTVDQTWSYGGVVGMTLMEIAL